MMSLWQEEMFHGGKKIFLVSFLIATLFLVSTANAAVTWNKPYPNGTTVSGNVELNVSVDTTDITGNVNTTFYYWDGSTWNMIAQDDSNRALPASFQVTWDTTTVSDGTDIQLNATAWNSSDYDYNATWYVDVDNTAPSVTIDNPDNTTYSSTQIDINASVTDSISSVSSVVAEVDSSTNVTLVSGTGNTYYNDTYNFSNGTHTVRIYAKDSEGNVNSAKTVTFTVNDNDPPDIYDVDSINNTYFRKDEIEN
ncbi:MAG: hypothetical protein ABEJ72_02355, partial [Candidatus Aenigmatarchaeota archaeon]